MPRPPLKINPYNVPMMNRRDAFKKIGFATGWVLITPSMVSLFQSCQRSESIWTPVFLSEEQGMILKMVADVFLPKSDTPSASEVKVPEFIDKYMDEVFDAAEQQRYKDGFMTLSTLLRSQYQQDLRKLSTEDYKNLLDEYMLVGEPQSSEEDSMTPSELLNSLKWMSINAYRTSETVGEKVLAYDPVPGTYYCGDLQELTGGKAWSL